MSSQQVFRSITRRYAISLALAPFMIFQVSTALAEGDWELEAIIVTAQKRSQKLQDVPISISTMSGKKIEETGLTNLEAISTYIPNFNLSEISISTTISIRGINSGINQGFEQSVGMYVDGVYHGRSQLARAPILDVERVEVLRGPQSILFGKNSIAGAISILSAKPTDEFEASITALYEPDIAETDLRFMVSGPLTDTLNGRIAMLSRKSDPWIENTFLKDQGIEEDGLAEQTIRGTLVWQPTDELYAALKVESGSFDFEGRNTEISLDTGSGLAPLYNTLSGGAILDQTQDFKREANGDNTETDTQNVTLTVEYEVGDNTLTSVSAYNAYEYEELCDCDFSPINTLTLELEEEFDQFSQEIRFTSPEGITLEYIAGLFYQQNDLEFNDDFKVPLTSPLTFIDPTLGPTLGGFNSVRAYGQDSTLWSVFSQVTWNINDQVKMSFGGRYTSEKKDGFRNFESATTGPNDLNFFGTGFSQLDFAEDLLRAERHSLRASRDESAFTPLVNMQFKPNEQVMLYASYTTGFKAGGFDSRSNASPDPAVGIPEAITNAVGAPPSPVGAFEFEEEKATSLEVGGKFNFLDGAAEFGVAFYRTEYEDLQVSIFDGGLGFNVGNAAEARVQGFELDSRWKASKSLTLSAALAYLDFEFLDYDNAECYFGQEVSEPDTVVNAALGICSFDGKRQAYTPELTGSLSVDYERLISDKLEFRVVLDAEYSDEYLSSTTLDPQVEQDSFVKLNARIAIGPADGIWELALVGRNLTDESVTTYSSETPIASVLSGGTGTTYYGFYQRPASVALQGTLRF